MRIGRHYLYGLLLFFELVLFCYYYLYGYHGIYRISALARNYEQLASETVTLEKKRDILLRENRAWHTDDVYYEQYARVYSVMGMPGEVWYRY